MPTAYRIFKTKFAKSWFDGEGAFLFGGRWNTRGTRVLYAAGSLSLATLEMLVHLDSAELLSSYSYATLEFEEKDVLPVEEFVKVPKNWSSSPPPLAVQRIGDKWAASMRSVVLRVPTSVVPGEFNYLVNVAHSGFGKARLGKPKPFNFDRRLFRPD
jgi:RES domain-containing protein